MINFVQRRAVRPRDTIGSCIHPGSRHDNLSNTQCAFALSDIVEKAGTERNVVGSFLVSRVVFSDNWSAAMPSCPDRTGANGSKKRRFVRSDSLARCAATQRALPTTAALGNL